MVTFSNKGLGSQLGSAWAVFGFPRMSVLTSLCVWVGTGFLPTWHGVDLRLSLTMSPSCFRWAGAGQCDARSHVASVSHIRKRKRTSCRMHPLNRCHYSFAPELVTFLLCLGLFCAFSLQVPESRSLALELKTLSAHSPVWCAYSWD